MTVTLIGDVITAVSVTLMRVQRRVAAAVPVVVVGKRIDEVKLDRVVGSSGTRRGSTRRSSGSGSKLGWDG